LAGCKTAEPIASINSYYLSAGKKICGRSNGDNFLTVKRPATIGDKCPDDTVLCGEDGVEKNNLVCASSIEKCPITFLAFVANGDLTDFLV